MFILRQATVDDHATLLKLAKMVRFVNLPTDAEQLRNKIVRSRKSFAGQAKDVTQREFMFVLEDASSGTVIGTSAIRACTSWPNHPHLFLNVEKREHYSDELQTGAVHVVLGLGSDISGKSELGGLVLSPAFRGHGANLGAQLSLIRFHYIGMHRDLFSPRMVSHLMPPLTPDSRNSLWEYLGRRFINLSYAEADEFSRTSKEFITSLFPKGEIYASLLPPEARALIGRVSDEALPARRMLEGLGFKFNNQIDPFDGGPTLEAAVTDVSIITRTRTGTLAATSSTQAGEGFVSAMSETGFRAARTPYTASGDEISVPAEAAEALGVSIGTPVGVTPLSDRAAPDAVGTEVIEAGEASA